METLVATVLIVIIFMISSMILNNIFTTSIKYNTRAIDAHLNELHYLYDKKKFKLPYQDDFKSWVISIKSYKDNNKNVVMFEAVNTETNKAISKEIIED